MVNKRSILMMIVAVAVVIVVIAAILAVGLSGSGSKTTTINKGTAPPEVVTYAADWPMANKDYNNSRTSTTSLINSNNVKDLGVEWSFPITGIGSYGGAASTPLILGNQVIFQDLRGDVTVLNLQNGNVIWATNFDNPGIEGPNGPAVGYGKVFVAPDKYNVTALNLTTGSSIWTTRLSYVATTGIDIQMTVYDNLVFVSTVPGTGDVFYAPGGIGVIFALDQASGKIMWNFTTVKDGYLWGHPEVNSGGGSWYPPAIDTNTGYMYWGVTNPAPFAGAAGWPSGSSFDTALYSDSLVSIDHNNGALKWYSQALGHDIWDHDLQVSPILTSANISGVQQDIVLAAGKMGNVYAFNRDTGAMLWKTPVGEHMNDYLDPISAPTTVMPGVLGGVETPMAYSNGMIFVPVIDMSTQYIPTGLNASSIDFNKGKGELVALDVKYGHIVWTQKFDSLNVGAATVVNDIVFTATYDGMIYGFNVNTGEKMFEYLAPAGINSWPAVSGDTIVWPCGVGGTPSLVAIKLGAIPQGPQIKITAPQSGATVSGPNVMVDASVINFNLVEPTGQANAAGTGHIVYYLDATPPTTPGQPATTLLGTYNATASPMYVWDNVSTGQHNISVQLVNNDNTPLSPAVFKTISVTVSPPVPTTNVFLQAQNIAFNVSTITVPAGSRDKCPFHQLG